MVIGSIGKLTNISDGGLGSIGFRHTDKHKAFKKQMMLDRNPMNNPLIREKQLVELKKAMNRLSTSPDQLNSCSIAFFFIWL